MGFVEQTEMSACCWKIISGLRTSASFPAKKGLGGFFIVSQAIPFAPPTNLLWHFEPQCSLLQFSREIKLKCFWSLFPSRRRAEKCGRANDCSSAYTFRGISVKKTQVALIIKIAHKTVNNDIFMLLLLVVNSNCYCGHLRARVKQEESIKCP